MRKVGKGLCIYVWDPLRKEIFDLHEGDEIEFEDIVLLTIDAYDQKPFEDYLRREDESLDKDYIDEQWQAFLKDLNEPLIVPKKKLYLFPILKI